MCFWAFRVRIRNYNLAPPPTYPRSSSARHRASYRSVEIGRNLYYCMFLGLPDPDPYPFQNVTGSGTPFQCSNREIKELLIFFKFNRGFVPVPVRFFHLWIRAFVCWMPRLKVSTNEKRCGLKVVAFDRLPLSYSRWDFQRNRCRPHPRPETTQRTLLMSFAFNNCLQITANGILSGCDTLFTSYT